MSKNKNQKISSYLVITGTIDRQKVKHLIPDDGGEVVYSGEKPIMPN